MNRQSWATKNPLATPCSSTSLPWLIHNIYHVVRIVADELASNFVL